MDFLSKLDNAIDSISNVLDDEKKGAPNQSRSGEHKARTKKHHSWRTEEEEAEFLFEKSTKFLTHFRAVRSGKPKCILVVDGGGLKGYMSIQILKTLETELKKLDKNLQLNKAFDLIMGTSTGMSARHNYKEKTKKFHFISFVFCLFWMESFPRMKFCKIIQPRKCCAHV